ncbi:GHKL domain-containing protein [Anaerostipes sp.]|uniref:GHKL domain-containing protein n=1 Tax=Anaerostipes sp. TaxID=1872530 RepID=UPI003967A00A
MKHLNLYKIEKYIILICIFSIPLHGILTNYMRHRPALWKHFFHEYYHIFFYDYMSLAMIIAFGSFIGLVFHVCKNARKTADFKNAKITHQAMLKQQDELENLKDMIMEKQAYIDQYLDCAMELGNNKQYEEMTVLISSLTSHVKRNYPDSFCKNALLNTLLQEKKVIADQSKIQCRFRIILPEHFDSYFSDFTITSLFSNLLDNAIEACRLCDPSQTDLFISLTTDFRANMFIVYMQNSKNPNEIFTHHTTKKESHVLHGHGLTIIEDIVSQYHGTCKWLDQKNSFSSELLFQLPND